MDTRSVMVLLNVAWVAAGWAQDYDPFAHYDKTRCINAGVGLSAAAVGGVLLTRESDNLRSVGRQMALVGLAEAAAAGAGLWTSTQERSEGVPPERKAEEFRQELLIGMLFDFVYLAAGVLMVQHGRRKGSAARGVRYITRGAFQLGFGAANYGLSLR